MSATTIALCGVLTALTLIVGGILAAANTTTRPTVTHTVVRTSTVLAAASTLVAFIHLTA
ncbi:hypothetical protein [Rhodococcus sp. IEGM 1379]|uniref:hypothetical protein n=1 Tax=Rhodococcus sp. IEGM 1379 TaxID=3047086 RepID=UPI0024B7C825|nr:hypothetical protein [Rhodococcus sp. IEGM 1379]MDI9915171.1 hypothetical protein [Rhodococcus sp. IEGM 1379]